MIQTDSGSYSAGLQLLFFDHFGKLVMWPPSQWPIRWTLTSIMTLVLVSSTFWSFSIIFPFFWVYSMDPDSSTWHSIYHSYLFIFDFLAILTAIKYLLKVPGIHMKSRMKYPGGLRMKYPLKVLGIYVKSTMKYPGGSEWNIHWKCQVFIWKVQWNTLGAQNEISTESARYLYEKHNEIPWGLRMKYPLTVSGIYMKSTMKYPGG